ncbi:MAG: XdhC/CoxF family protein [Actinomycetaceae bacterium]|nr:XdhC/CoxF family protein [Actinomycetaceae bacterium]
MAQLKPVLRQLIDELNEGITPTLTSDDFPCFSPLALATKPHIKPGALSEVLDSLSKADIPTLERALAAIDADEKAWLGFKIVTDKEAALSSEDTDVIGMREQGSADSLPGIFFATDDREVVFSREISERDRFQMLDVTRGPSMHDEQYAGVSWLSLPLFVEDRVFILGASAVSVALERYANDAGFNTVVVDYDPAYLTAERFPRSERILIPSFDELDSYLDAKENDYLCVLTRGHMYDPECLIYGITSKARYVGMLGHPLKNERVLSLIEERGYDRGLLDGVLYAPIGIKFGAKGPVELGMCIVAQLIQIRAERRK